jgi:hypothetical protein
MTEDNGCPPEPQLTLKQIIMDASPAAWDLARGITTPTNTTAGPINFYHSVAEEAERPERVEFTCTVSDLPTTRDEPSLGDQWVLERISELTEQVTSTVSTTTDSDFERLGQIVGDTLIWISENDSHMVDELPETVDPQNMESSSPLRADDDQGDTMGQEFDVGCEMGEAEEWFRDKIRVR